MLQIIRASFVAFGLFLLSVVGANAQGGPFYSEVSSDETHHSSLITHHWLPPVAAWYLTTSDGTQVEILGAGLLASWSGSHTLNIPNAATVQKVIVEASYRHPGGTSTCLPTDVVFSTNLSQTATVTGTALAGGGNVNVYRTEFVGNIGAVTLTDNEGCKPYAFVVYVFRSVAVAPGAASVFIDQYFASTTGTFSISIPTHTSARDITVQIPVGGLGCGPTATISVAASGATTQTVSNFSNCAPTGNASVTNLGDDLALVSVTLADVPGATGSISVQINQPSAGSGAFFIAGAANASGFACDNVTSGGTISASQTNCDPFDPALISSTAAASGGSGTLEYQWRFSSDNSLPVDSWTAIAGATAATYDPPAVSSTTYFVRLARRQGCGVFAGQSNIVEMKVAGDPAISIIGPTVGCPSDALGFAASGPVGTTFSWNFGANASPATATGAGPHAVSYSDCGEKTVTLTGNLAGCESTATQSLFIEDATYPTLVGVPGNTTAQCSAIPAAPTVTATDNCPNPVVTFAETTVAGSCTDSYQLHRTWTATDGCGNQTIETQIITVVETTPPTFTTFPADATVSCASIPAPVSPTATDNCDGSPNLAMTTMTVPGICANSYVLKRTWTATDNCGNSATQTQTITVQDLVPPVLSDAPADLTISCSTVPVAVTLTATDDCSGTVAVGFSETSISCGCDDGYILMRTWSASDGCGNGTAHTQEVKVQDVVPPVFANVPANVTVGCGAVPAATNPTATDDCDNSVDVTLAETTVGGGGSCAAGQSYILRTWTATDNCGNTATATQQVFLQDSQPPTFAGLADATVSCTNVPPTPTPIVTDDCDATPTVTLFEYVVNGLCSDSYKIIRIWTATDDCGNSSTASQQVFVGDSQPPVLGPLPGDMTVQCDEVPPVPIATATDDCDTDISIGLVEIVVPGSCPFNRQIIRTWTATDNCVNQDTHTQILTVVDNEAPLITGAVADVTVACADIPAAGSVSASDNCDPNFTLVFGETIFPGSCPDNYTIERAWIATDGCFNQTAVFQYITVQDTGFPDFTAPDNVTVECSAVPAAPTIVATDDCDTNVAITFTTSNTQNPSTASCANANYIITRTWRAVDNCNHRTTKTQTITVRDTQGPSFVGFPDDVTLACGTALPAVTNPTATDNCDPVVPVIYVGQTSTQSANTNDCLSNTYTVSRTWRATDNCGNSSLRTQTITVQDIVPPTFATFPADLTTNCSGLPAATSPTATDNCDPSVALAMTETTVGNAGDCSTGYAVHRTWTATDNCGNTAVQTQVIHIQDVVPPVLANVPANATVSCDAIPAAPMVTATDACDPNVPVLFSENITPGACADAYTIVRTWSATDDCGNTATASQTIQVQDNAAPTFAGFPIDVTVTCGSIPALANPTATDNCDTDVNISFSETSTQTNTGNCSDNNYTISRTWTATDNCGNPKTQTQTITVQDNAGPTLAGVPANVTVECGNIPVAPTVTASDACGAASVSLAETTVPGPCNDNYLIVRTWTATDGCGNTATGSQTITVNDLTAPALANVPANATASCDAIPTAATVIATDNCDTNVAPVFSENVQPGSCPGNYVLVRTWTATDDCGNSVSATQTIQVQDVAPPTFASIPANVTISCGDPLPSTIPAATDNCDASVFVNFSDSETSGTCPGNRIITRTFTATDDCGNTTTAVQLIEIQDVEPPILANVPANVTLGCGEPLPTNLPTATDNCDANVAVTFADSQTPGGCSAGGAIVRTFTATDDCGNTATATQLIEIQDNEAPVLANVPANLTLGCGESLPTTLPTATDNCDQNVAVTFADSQTPGGCSAGGAIVRTFTATDDCGNTATATQLIEIQDVEPPVLANVPADATASCDNIPTAPTVTATDNCDANVAPVFSENVQPGSCPGNYVLLRTWTATDDCGNATTATQHIEIQDNEVPTLAGVPTDLTITEYPVPNPPVIGAGGVLASDNCGTAAVTFAETGGSGCEYTIVRTWTATDQCGNTTTQSQTITVNLSAVNAGSLVGPAAPVCLNGGSVGIAAGTGTAPTVPAGYTIIYVLSKSPSDGILQTGATPSFTVTSTGAYSIQALVYNATPGSDNYLDFAAATTIGDLENAIGGGTCASLSDPATVTVEECSGEIGGLVTLNCGANTTPLPDVPVTLTGTTNSGAPVNMSATTDATGRYRFQNVQPGSYTVSFVAPASPTGLTGGAPVSVSLAAGENYLTADATFTDEEAPVLANVPANATLNCDDALPTDLPTTTDNTDTNVSVSFADSETPGTCPQSKTVTRTFTATDDCGNSATATQTIHIQDVEPPVLANVPANETASCDNIPTAPTVTATDNCDTNVAPVFSENVQPGSCPGNYTLIRTWTATDDCGNAASASQTIQIQDVAP
ncbi:MAG: SdrD B-like domain-containing protein, partial [Saprospiraceae bacterium]